MATESFGMDIKSLPVELIGRTPLITFSYHDMFKASTIKRTWLSLYAGQKRLFREMEGAVQFVIPSDQVKIEGKHCDYALDHDRTVMIFDEWSMSFIIKFITGHTTQKKLLDELCRVGKEIGIGAYREQGNGRFTVSAKPAKY